MLIFSSLYLKEGTNGGRGLGQNFVNQLVLIWLNLILNYMLAINPEISSDPHHIQFFSTFMIFYDVHGPRQGENKNLKCPLATLLALLCGTVRVAGSKWD